MISSALVFLLIALPGEEADAVTETGVEKKQLEQLVAVNAVSFENIEGHLESINMRCDNKRFESTVSDVVDWTIPDEWGICFVHVYGKPGTTFDVLMLQAT